MRPIAATIASAALAALSLTSGTPAGHAADTYYTASYTYAAPDPNADSDGDGLVNWREDQLGTNKWSADTDADGYRDGEEVNNALFSNPGADYHTPGVYRADPKKPDIFVEVDYMRPKTARVPYFWTPWHGWYYTTVVVEPDHQLDGDDAGDMIARFKEHGWNVHIVISDQIPHEDTVSRSRWNTIAAGWRDCAPYYHCLIAHKAGSGMAGGLGVADGIDKLIILDGEVAIQLMQGPDVMHELGHLLIDSAHDNPAAAHLLDYPSEWNDGIHCPYNCVMNYVKNLSFTELVAQWWMFDYDWRCWGAIGGRYRL